MFAMASLAVLVIMALALARALMGPSVFDRILAVSHSLGQLNNELAFVQLFGDLDKFFE